MHGEIYKLVESMESIIERYPLDELRALGLELRRHSEKKGLNPIEEIVLRRVGGMILEAQRVRQKQVLVLWLHLRHSILWWFCANCRQQV